MTAPKVDFLVCYPRNSIFGEVRVPKRFWFKSEEATIEKLFILNR